MIEAMAEALELNREIRSFLDRSTAENWLRAGMANPSRVELDEEMGAA
jgi:hypothetical protein